jgi:hypothetical protein
MVPETGAGAALVPVYVVQIRQFALVSRQISLIWVPIPSHLRRFRDCRRRPGKYIKITLKMTACRAEASCWKPVLDDHCE